MTEIDPFTHKIWVNGSLSHFLVKFDPFTHILWVNGSILVSLKLYIRSLM